MSSTFILGTLVGSSVLHKMCCSNQFVQLKSQILLRKNVKFLSTEACVSAADGSRTDLQVQRKREGSGLCSSTNSF